MSNIGINGFGRIGRMVLRIAMDRNIQIIAINDPYLSIDQMVYMFEHDSTHGFFSGTVCVDGPCIVINGKHIIVSHITDPKEINWCCLGAHYIVETSGSIKTLNQAWYHLEGGARKVIIAASLCEVPPLVYGVNMKTYEPRQKVISCGSAATNCLAPLIRVINKKFSICEGTITVIRATTNAQKTLDSSVCQSWRQGRSSQQNMIVMPTTDAEEIAKAIPSLSGKLCSMEYQIPLADVSVLDFNVYFKKPTKLEDINSTIMKCAKTDLKDVIGYSTDGVVSSDFITNSYSTIYDASAGIQLSDKFLKIIAWFDNEYAYAGRILELIEFIQCKDGYISCPYDCKH